MAEVNLRDVRKAYGTVQVLRGIDVDVADGEFVALVGPSGCGKSTLLRMIAGLEDIAQGEIRIDDRLVNNVPPKQRDVAMVFQNYALYPHMTVARNMGFSLKLAGRPQKEIDERVAAAAAILDLSALLDRYPRQLSGGQRQRVAMGRAIVRDPQVFLFDEPLSNLDAKLRVQMRAEIKALHQRLRTTTVYVTHDQVEAMTMADKIVVMRDGHVEQIGAPLDLYDHPQNMFVAGFIGSPAMNFIKGWIEDGQFHGPGNIIAPAKDAGVDTMLDGVVLGIRPEHLLLDPAGVEATVTVVEQTGSETYLLLDIDGQRINYLGRERVAIGPGDKVRITPDPARLHFFDEKTGQRLGAPASSGLPSAPLTSPGLPSPEKPGTGRGSSPHGRKAGQEPGARARAGLGSAAARVLSLVGIRADGYRPELHYMRGSGPASTRVRGGSEPR
jgi:multiple sugar transport system ATP-binding protein